MLDDIKRMQELYRSIVEPYRSLLETHHSLIDHYERAYSSIGHDELHRVTEAMHSLALPQEIRGAWTSDLWTGQHAELEQLKRRIAEASRADEARLAVFAPEFAAAEVAQQQLATLTGVLERVGIEQEAITSAATAVAMFDASTIQLLEQMRSLNLAHDYGALADRIMLPTRAYGDFVERTLLEIESAGPHARMLRASLTLAEHQIAGATSDVAAIIQRPVNLETLSPQPRLTAFTRQQAELIDADDRVEDETDVDELASVSLISETVQLARDVVGLVIDANETRKASGGVEIFAPTTRLISSLSDLLFIVAHGRGDLGLIADALFVVLYEAAGKDNLRYLQKNGGPMSEADCHFVWRVKHIRAWLRHDLDHGSESDKKRKWVQLGEDLAHLTGTRRIPSRPDEFFSLQRRLLQEAKRWLERLRDSF